MKDKDKTKEQLINELAGLRQRIADVENRSAKFREVKEGEGKLLRDLKSIVENIPFGFIYLDSEFRIISSNKFFNDFAGFREGELNRKLCYEIVGEYSDDPTKKGHEKICSFCKKRECFEKKSPTVMERPLGDKFIRVTTIPELDEKGQICRFMEIVEDITERKKAEEELFKANQELEIRVEERTKELSSIYDAITDFLTVIGTDYRILRVNKVIENTWGKDLIGKLCYEAYQGREKICPDCPAKEAFETKKPAYSIQEPTLEGIPPVEINAFPILNEEGEVTAVVEHGKDITERLIAEKALRLFERIVSVTGDHLSFISNDYIYQIVNSSYLRAHKKLLEDIVGHSVSDLMGEEVFKENVKHNIDRCLNGEEINYQAWFEFPGLGWRFMDVFYYPYFEKEGVISGVVVSSHDITERKKAEQALQKEKEKLQKYLDISAVMVVMLNADQKVTLINKKGCDILGCIAEEIIGVNWFDNFLPEKGRAEVKAIFNKLMTGKIKPVEYYENVVLTKNGEERLIAWYNTVFRDEDGNITNTLGVGVDITESRNTEIHMKASLNEKEMLLQEIHHRVKNNMTVISSLLKLQSDKVKDKRYKAMFEDSMNRIRTMARIHEKLYRARDLAKINFGAYLNDMVDNMYMSYGLNHKIVKLSKDIGNVKLGINNAIPFGLIVNELLSNSLKYAFPEGRGGEIKVVLCMNDKDEVELTVGDNGAGMPSGIDMDKVDSLGLSLVSALVKQLQGKIKLNKEKGTEFRIAFRKRI